MSRLFVAVWPPEAVLDRVAGLARSEIAGVRWTTPDQWHVTLRFLGSVTDVDPVTEAVARVAAGVEPVEARLGPATARLGRTVLQVPVAGLDAVADEVVDATADLGTPPDDRPFTGHLTLARAKRRLPASVVGLPLAATWTVTELAVVASDTHPDGARYADVARLPLGG